MNDEEIDLLEYVQNLTRQDITPKDKKKQLKLDGKPVKADYYKIIDEEQAEDHNTTIEILNELLKQEEEYQDKLLQISFTYDDKLSFSISHGFFEVKQDGNLYGDTYSFFDDYPDTKHRVQDVITGFAVFYVDKPQNAGGCDGKYNNCLYHCLQDSMGDRVPWKQAQNMKKFLKLKKNDKVPYELLDQLEEKIKANIILSGSYVRESSMQYAETIRITLKDGHYSLTEKRTRLQKQIEGNCRHYHNEPEKKLLIFQNHENKIRAWDGATFTHVDKSKYTTLEGLKIKCPDDEDIKEFYNMTKTDFNLLKELSNGKYNPFKFYNIIQLAEDIFLQNFKGVEPEPIEQEEALILNKAMGGGVRYAKPGTYKNAYDYDINRFYPHLQLTLSVPVSKPTFKTIEELPDILKYGIYKCQIITKNKLFKANRYNLYTHYDLNAIRETMKAEIKLIKNDGWNLMQYEGKRIQLSRLGKDYKKLYDISKKGCKVAKMAMNCLWGAISRRKFKLLYTDTLNEPLELNLKDKLRKLEYSDVIQVEKTDTFKAYANDIGGRFSVFLTAKGRYKLNQIIQPHKKYIKYVHTDGWISSKELDLTLSDEFGGVRLDKKGDVEIINKNIKKYI